MIEKLRKLGYRVEAAQQIDNDELPTVYYVEGPQIALYVAEEDTEAWKSLLASHKERVLQESETDEETRARLGLDEPTEEER